MNNIEIRNRCEKLREIIPRTKMGDPKTDRLEKLDSMLYSYKFAWEDLDFVEKEIMSAVEFFKNKKPLLKKTENKGII